MSVAVVSALYGPYDTVIEPVPQRMTVERWIMVTDRPDLIAPGWEVIVEPRPHVHPNVAAKVPKLFPEWYAPEVDVTVWMDASCRPTPSTVGITAMAARATSRGLSLLTHPNRDDIGDEVPASEGCWPKYEGLPMREQVDHYFSRGMPRSWGLWATGLIGRTYQFNHEIGKDWMAEIVRWGFQDQLSLPYVLWNWGIRPEPIKTSIWDIFPGHAAPVAV